MVPAINQAAFVAATKATRDANVSLVTFQNVRLANAACSS